ncbi:MAG TPA: hypothetical protein PKW14_05910 [Bacteroidota bacterium]|jgi:hypothetical protein|nr:hypothetical protein [Bacteroidota bacterium]
MKIKIIITSALLSFFYFFCSSSNNEISNDAKYKLYLDTLNKKYYYLFDSTRLYVLIPDSISKYNPEFIYEDSKGYPFLSLNNEKFEVDIDTTNSLYMVNDTKSITYENKSITTKNKKVVKSKVKKRPKSTTKSKK